MKKHVQILLLPALMLAISACQKDVQGPDSSNDCPVNFSAHPKQQQYQQLLDDYLKKGFVGITLLVDNPADGLWIGASGFADIENGLRMNACHLHHSASIYKTYIATIILQLAEEGKLALEDKLDKYISTDVLKRIPNGEKVSILNLLQHRSGMPDVFEADFLLDFFNHPNITYSIEELLHYVYGRKALSEPGTDFYYSDTNFALLSVVINHLEGSYISAVQTRIFDKLGMHDAYIIDDVSQAPHGLSGSYWDRYGDGKIENVSDWQITLTAGLRGTDGIITSADDMKKFIKGLMEGALLSPASLSLMSDVLEIPMADRKQGFVAYGLGLGEVSVSPEIWYGHFGSHIGSGAIALYNPARKTTLVAFQNKGTFLSDQMQALFFAHFIQDLEKIAFE